MLKAHTHLVKILFDGVSCMTMMWIEKKTWNKTSPLYRAKTKRAD